MLVIGTTSAICTRVDGHDRGRFRVAVSIHTCRYSSRQARNIRIYLHGADMSDTDSVNSKGAPSPGTGTNSSHNASKWPIQ